LRFVHLDTHLRTPDILSAEQINKYNTLRGYSSNDPCENIPEGHSVNNVEKAQQLRVIVKVLTVCSRSEAAG